MGTVCLWSVLLQQQDAEHLLRLGLAVACGLAVGVNRLHASHSHPGRVRVHVLVALSSCLFALAAGVDANATSRAIQGVATGVGFLGAGEILVEPRQGKHSTPVVRGLTSAAAVWFTAALGITAGVASPFLAGMALLLALLTLSGPLPPQPPNNPQS